MPTQTKNLSLFATGYGCMPWTDGADGLWIVTGGQHAYMVDAINRTCDCRATVACKHVKMLCELVFDSIDAYDAKGQAGKAQLLRWAWGETTAAMADAARFGKKTERRTA